MRRQAELAAAAAAEGVPASGESDEELAKQRMSQWVKGAEGEGDEAADDAAEAAEEAVEEPIEVGPLQMGPLRWTTV